MKKFLIASGVAALAFVSIASAAGYMFNTNLTVGSTGPDVVALQTWLNSNGFTIPAIASGATQPGYFGTQTKSAVMKYQASKGVPNTGFVGPLTRAQLNLGGTVGMPSSCPIAGWVQATYQGVSYCVPPGYAAPGTPTPGTPTPGTISTPGVAGTLAFALQSTPSNGTSVDKGGIADVARYKLQAGASDMAVSSLALDFDSRFWLYASSVTVKDDSGAIVAQKTGLTQSDFTELNVATSYRLYVPIANYIVPKAATRYFVVSVSLLPVTDRSAGNLTITQAQVRSIDGTGVTDTQTDTADRYFAYTGSNNGQVIVSLDGTSPIQRLVQISTSGETDMVPLAVYSVKSQNKDGNLRSLKLAVRTNGVAAVTSLFNDIKLKSGSLTYSADSIAAAGASASPGDTAASSTVTFTNLQIPLSKDQDTLITVYGKIAKDTSNVLDGAMASTSIIAGGTAGGTTNNPMVEDSTFNSTAVNYNATLVSSDAIFSASSAVITGPVATITSQPVGTSGVLASLGFSFVFTITAGDNTLYVPSDPYKLFATSTTGFGADASTTWSTSITPNPSAVSGDDTTVNKVYVIPARNSRTFTVTGRSDNTNGTGSSKTVAVTAIYYGTSATNPRQYNINYNLGTFKVSY